MNACSAHTDVLASYEDRDEEIYIECSDIGPVTDSSSDYSQRTGFDIPSLQQELRTTPEGARRETDDPLPDRIKVKPPQFYVYFYNGP